MHRICSVLAVGACLASTPARAQAIDGNGVPFRQWDFNTGFALHFEDAADLNATNTEFGSWRGAGAVALQGGRYWTSHLKTEAGVLFVAPAEDYGGDSIPLPGGLTGFATYRIHTKVTHVTGALTYQFFENVFAHPYVSAGARVGIGSAHKTRDGFAFVSTRGAGAVNVPLPPLDERRAIVEVRPFASAGFKSYFTERTFVRSELSTVFSSIGLTQLSLGLGFGVDF